MALHKQVIFIDLAYIAYSYIELILQPTPLADLQISETLCLKLNKLAPFIVSNISRFLIFS